MAYDIPTMVSEATGVLKSLIAIPSLSRDEEKAADYLQNYIERGRVRKGEEHLIFLEHITQGNHHVTVLVIYVIGVIY